MSMRFVEIYLSLSSFSSLPLSLSLSFSLSYLTLPLLQADEGTPRAMVCLLEARGQTVDFLNSAITKEVGSTSKEKRSDFVITRHHSSPVCVLESASTLFRSNSATTKLISCYFFETG